MVDAVLVFFADAEHHGGGGAHAELVRGAVHVEPVGGQAFQAGDLVADFVVENFGAAAGDGIKSGGAQFRNGLANREAAVLGNGDNLRRGVAVQMDFREALSDPAQHALVPVDLQVGMQAALHQHAGAAEFDGLADLFVNGVEVEDVSLFGRGAFQRTVKRAEGAVLGAEIRVVDVSIDDVRRDALRMQLPAHGVSFHADADEVVGGVEVEGLGFGEGHVLRLFYCIASPFRDVIPNWPAAVRNDRTCLVTQGKAGLASAKCSSGMRGSTPHSYA